MSGTIAALTRTVDDIAGTGASAIDLTGMLSFGRVLTTVAVIAVMEVILLSALATLFAYLYNLSVAITGGRCSRPPAAAAGWRQPRTPRPMASVPAPRPGPVPADPRATIRRTGSPRPP